jgi:hypothetical protein
VGAAPRQLMEGAGEESEGERAAAVDRHPSQVRWGAGVKGAGICGGGAGG